MSRKHVSDAGEHDGSREGNLDSPNRKSWDSLKTAGPYA